MKIDLRQLRHVLALDQFRNFARAAEAVGLTQPALSRSIQVLEKSIGAKLFDRDRTRVEPTLIGERLIVRAQPLLSQARDIEHDLRQLLGLEVGLLRIGAGPYPADMSVGTAVGRLVRRHPGLSVDLSVDDWPALVQRVVSGELDLAIAEISLAVHDERLHVEPLQERQGIFYCRPDHPLASGPAPTLHQVRSYPLVGTSIPTRLAQLTGAKKSEIPSSLPQGVATPEIRVETVRLACRIVMESDAIGIAILSQIKDEMALGRLVALPLQLPWVKTNYGIIRLANRTPAPVAMVFMDLLREVEAEID
jgi:DNA-binding transcriptional LysR family regulator